MPKKTVAGLCGIGVGVGVTGLVVEGAGDAPPPQAENQRHTAIATATPREQRIRHMFILRGEEEIVDVELPNLSTFNLTRITAKSFSKRFGSGLF